MFVNPDLIFVKKNPGVFLFNAKSSALRIRAYVCRIFCVFALFPVGSDTNDDIG